MQIEYISVPCESLSLSSGFLTACLPKIFKYCVRMSNFANNIQKKKVMVTVVKALTPHETNYSFTLKCSTKLLVVLIEFFFFSSLSIPWWIWNAPVISARSCAPSMPRCAWSTAGSRSRAAGSARERSASAPSSWRCLGSLGPRIWSAQGEKIYWFFHFSKSQVKILLWSRSLYVLKQLF